MHPDTGTTDREPPALFVAVREGNYAIAQRLLLHGAEVNYPTSSNDSCRSVVFVAVDNGNAEMVKLLAAHGGDFKSKRRSEEYTRTPLHDAVWSGHVDVVKVLLELGVGVDERDGGDHTPLKIAEIHANDNGVRESKWELMVQIAELLVGAGAHASHTEEDLIRFSLFPRDWRRLKFLKIMIAAKHLARWRENIRVVMQTVTLPLNTCLD